MAIALRWPISESLAILGRSPLVAAEKTRRIVLETPNGRNGAVDFFRNVTGTIGRIGFARVAW